MGRRATTKIDTRARRRALARRAKPYFFTVAPRILLGYVAGSPGYWVVQRETGRTAEGAPIRARARLGIADDTSAADGRDVLTYAQGFAAALTAMPQSRARPLTVADAIRHYVESLAGDEAGYAKARLARHVPDALGTTRINDLTLTGLRQWRDALAQAQTGTKGKRRAKGEARTLAPATVNRIIASMKAALNHAYRDEANGITTDAAWRRLESLEGAHRAREHHFSEDEVRRLVAAANDADPEFALLLAAGYLTGCRYGELAACCVRHLDERRRVLAIPSGKTGARAVTLSSEAATLFARAAKGRPKDAPLFAKADGSRWGKSEQHRRMKAALKAAELDTGASFYALRHSYISRAIEAGMPMLLIAQNCGTSTKMIEQTYGKFLASARRDLIERAAPKLGLAA